jgi:hypothetical protein
MVLVLGERRSVQVGFEGFSFAPDLCLTESVHSTRMCISYDFKRFMPNTFSMEVLAPVSLPEAIEWRKTFLFAHAISLAYTSSRLVAYWEGVVA